MKNISILSVTVACLILLFNGCGDISNPYPGKSDTDFVGLELVPARALAKERGLLTRVIEIDGEPLPDAGDFFPNRVNFTIQDKIVIKTSRK